MQAPQLLVACLALTCQAAVAGEQLAPSAEPKWLTDANGCKFLAPPSSRGLSSQATIAWDGGCVDGFVSGPGELQVGRLTFRGEFSQGRIVKGVVEEQGITIEGSFADNAPHGDTIVHLPDGTTGKVTFNHGEIDPPYAEITWPSGSKYRGEIDPVTRFMHGKGIIEYADGSVYEGEFKHNRVEGAGVMKRASGEVRLGTFVDGQLVGKGSVLYSNQARYEGELRADEPNGAGRMEFADGTLYEGAFVAGKYQGQGKLKFANGTIYEGQFLAGDFSGSGTLSYPSGNLYIGQFLYGKRHGTGRFTQTSGAATYEGEWKADALNGKCHIVFEESVYDGQCLDGKASGPGHLEDKARNLVYQGNFIQDQFEGQGSLHIGALAYEGAFKAGVMQGPGTLTVGKLTMRGDFKSGVLARGTITGGDGRTFEVDIEKDEILEVMKDGTKRPIDALPPDITI